MECFPELMAQLGPDQLAQLKNTAESALQTKESEVTAEN
jgi:hypothetical protein